MSFWLLEPQQLRYTPPFSSCPLVPKALRLAWPLCLAVESCKKESQRKTPSRIPESYDLHKALEDSQVHSILEAQIKEQAYSFPL